MHPVMRYARPKPNDPDIVHVRCCEYESIALCSLDVSDDPVTPDDEETTCVVCAELELDDEFCPVNGPKGCLP